MERIQFNTGRGYSENGQRIVAVKHEGRIYFQDHDRHIDGSFDAADDELFGPVELNQVVVMSRYDHGNYEYHPMTIDVQQALIWQVRCHKCHQVVTKVTPVDREDFPIGDREGVRINRHLCVDCVR